MSSALDLVVLNGPLEGEVVQLKPNEPLVIGRSKRGLQLIDPLVSLTHAEITWEGDRYWIQDKASATGTYVNDVRLTERAVVLVPGMRIRAGETDLEVRERPRSALLRVVGLAAGLFILFLGVRSFMDSIEVEYDPTVRWFEPVRQGAGVESQLLRIPTAFIRETGVDHRELTIEQVTDFDANGVDELWLKWPDGRRMVTFNPDGSWRTITELAADCRVKGRALSEGMPAECYADSKRVRTELPPQCRDYQSSNGFPDLECNGSTYRYDGRRYALAEHEGVYAWMPPTRLIEVQKGETKVTERVLDEGPVEPHVFTLVRDGELAGFLAERGVVEAIHYLICEDGLPGARAQVLTEAGENVPLSMGCIGDIVVEGPTRTADFANGLPMIFAFTGAGYEALIKDVAIYLSGSEDLIFMNRNQRAFYDRFSAPPVKRRGAIRIGFQGSERIFNPVAREGAIPDGHAILASEFAPARPPVSRTVIIDRPGRYPLEGCSELQVDLADWHCLFTKGCTATSTFVRMQNVGCQGPDPIAVPYARAVHAYADPFIEGRIAVDSIDQDNQIDVLRVRFAYRARPPE